MIRSRTLVEPRTTWLPMAECRYSDPDTFDVHTNVHSGPPSNQSMVRMWGKGIICESCPVITQCAADALAGGDRGVVRGGVPVVAHCDLSWRRMEQAALGAIAEAVDPVEARRVWQVAAQRAAAKRRTERKEA